MPERPQTADVVVVGGGPAGSAAAITLARLGRRVVVVDKAVFPRDKCCGDGLTTAALRRAEHLGLDPADVKSWEPVDEAVVVGARGSTVRLPMPDDGTQFAASARRADLDAALIEVAKLAGAQVVEGCGVVDVTSNDRNVFIDLENGGQLGAHYVIACDGMWSSVRKAVSKATPHPDKGAYLGDWQAGRQYFENVGPEARKLWVWFEPDTIPGYAWSFPLPNGTANVGYGVIRQDGQPLGNLKGQRIDFLERPHIAAILGPDARPAGPWKAWPIPAQISETPLTALNGRVLFAGDAARACDPMTGEGIAQAFETAELAATAIANAGPDAPADASRRYQRQIRWGLALDDRLAKKLSGILARGGGSDKAIGVVDTNDWCRRQFVRWMFEDYPRAGPITPQRWRRHMFGSAGAYRAP